MFELLEARRLFAAGDIDRSFGTNGFVTGGVDLPIVRHPGVNDFQVESVLDRGDRRILVGTALAGSAARSLVVIQIDENGLLDTAFAEGGVRVTTLSDRENLAPFEAALDSAGRLVILSNVRVSRHVTSHYVLRLRPNGAIDRSFASNGRISFSLGSDGSVATSIAIDSRDRLLIAGAAVVGEATRMSVARLDMNGQFDAGFASNGVATFAATRYGDSRAEEVIAPGSFQQGEGRVVLAGVATARTGKSVFAIAELDDSGRLRGSFSDDGIFTKRVSPHARGKETAISIASVTSDGGLIVAGNVGLVGLSGETTNANAVLRLDFSGRLAPTFNGDGIALLTTDSFSPRPALRGGLLFCPAGERLFRYDISEDGLPDRVATTFEVAAPFRPRALAIGPDGGDVIIAGEEDDNFENATRVFDVAVNFQARSIFDQRSLEVPSRVEFLVLMEGKLMRGDTDAFGKVYRRYDVSGALDTLSFGSEGVYEPGRTFFRSRFSYDVRLLSDGRLLFDGSGVQSDSDGAFGFFSTTADAQPDMLPDYTAREQDETQWSARRIWPDDSVSYSESHTTETGAEHTFLHVFRVGENNDPIGIFGDLDEIVPLPTNDNSFLRIEALAVLAIPGNTTSAFARTRIRSNGEEVLVGPAGFGTPSADARFGYLRGSFDALAAQRGGKLLHQTSQGIRRLDARGRADSSFGASGVLVDSGFNFAIDRKDRIYLWQQTGRTFVIRRYTPDGKPDNTFDGNGQKTLVMPFAGRAEFILTSDNKVLVSVIDESAMSDDPTNFRRFRWSATRLSGD